MDKETREFLENMSNHINLRFDNLSTQVKENTEMLKGLEENAKITRSEIENVSNDVVHIKGDMEALRKDISIFKISTRKSCKLERNGL